MKKKKIDVLTKGPVMRINKSGEVNSNEKCKNSSELNNINWRHDSLYSYVYDRAIQIDIASYISFNHLIKIR